MIFKARTDITFGCGFHVFVCLLIFLVKRVIDDFYFR